MKHSTQLKLLALAVGMILGGGLLTMVPGTAYLIVGIATVIAGAVLLMFTFLVIDWL